MVAYIFKRMFVPMAGEKNHTIRGHRRRHARAGELVQMYTGPRFKPERIGVSTCIFAEPISLGFKSGNPFVVIPKRYDLHKRLRALISLPLNEAQQ